MLLSAAKSSQTRIGLMRLTVTKGGKEGEKDGKKTTLLHSPCNKDVSAPGEDGPKVNINGVSTFHRINK